jgi:hypothetical protein
MQKITFFVALCTFFFCANAQQNVQNLHPTRVSIFKNGNYFVKRSGTVNLVNKQFYLQPPTDVLMGGYWLGSSNGNEVKVITIKTDTIKVQKNCSSISDYLMANIGKNITLLKNDVKQSLLEGTLQDFNLTNGYFKIQTADSKIIIAKITDFEQLQMQTKSNSTYKADSISDITKVKLSRDASNSNISLLSLHKGLQWMPSYLLTVINDKEANLQLKATISSGTESYMNTDVDILIGNPTMFYKQAIDPICENMVREILGTRTYMQQAVNGVSMQNSNASGYRISDDYEGINDRLDIGGEKLEDLYMYKLGKMDIEANSKIIVPIYNSKVTYEDAYTLEIRDNQNSIYSPLAVKHFYTIKNNTAAPFTTGPVLVTNKEDMLLAQSQMAYTPVSSTQSISLSDAIDVAANIKEVVTSREKQKIEWRNNVIEKVNFTGTIKVRNFQKKTIKLKITKEIKGKFIKVSNNGKTNSYKSETSLNESSLVTWEITIEPNTTIDLIYEASVLEKLLDEEEEDK